MFFLFAKFAPHLAEIREKLEQPTFLARQEAVINHTSEAQERLAVDAQTAAEASPRAARRPPKS